jgi:hypothetical protein
MPTKFPDQKAIILGFSERLGLDYQGLADAIGINRETMRKYLGGYQPMPPVIKRSLELLQKVRNSTIHPVLKDEPASGQIAAIYTHLSTETLLSSLSDLATKIKTAQKGDRRFMLLNLGAMVEDLLSRMANEAQTKASGGSYARPRGPRPKLITPPNSERERVKANALAAGARHAGIRQSSDDTALSEQPPGAVGSPSHKSGQHQASGPGTKAPHPAHEEGD